MEMYTMVCNKCRSEDINLNEMKCNSCGNEIVDEDIRKLLHEVYQEHRKLMKRSK